VRFLGRLLCEAEAHVDLMDGATPAEELGNEDRAVETSTRQHGDALARVRRRGGGSAHDSPRYTHPDVHVSRTTMCDSSGKAG